MSFADRCQHAFSARTRDKGEAYFRRGAVRLEIVGDGGLASRVRGSEPEPYHGLVSWAEPDIGLVVSCTCPHFEGGDFCKHLWATLLAADARRLARAVADRPGRLRLIHRFDIEADDEPYDDWEEDDFLDDDAYRAFDRRGGESRGGKGTGLSWQAELERLPRLPTAKRAVGAAPAAAERDDAELRFALDVAESFRAGGVVIDLYRRSRKKNGAWGAFKPLRVHRGKLGEFAPGDRRLLALLLGSYAGVPWSGYGATEPLHGRTYQEASRIELTEDLQEHLLPELCGSGLLYCGDAQDQPVEESTPLAWDDGAPWQFRLIVQAAPQREKAWKISGALAQGRKVEPLASPRLLLSNGLVVFPGRIARFEAPSDWRWVQLLRARDEIKIPFADREKLLRELWSTGIAASAQLPDELRLAAEPATPRGSLRIFPEPDASKFPRYHKPGTLYADLAFEYGSQRVAPESPAAAVIDGEANRVLLRDFDAEQRLIRLLADLRIGPQRPLHYYDPPGNVELPRKEFATVVARLASAGWHVEAEGKVIRRPGEFRATLSSGVDWFDLETAIDFDGVAATLPQLLDALKRHERFVTLDDGTQGMLPEEWLARYAPLAELAAVEGDRLRFRPSQALLLDALLAGREGELHVEVDRKFARMRDRLRSFAGVKPRSAPRGFRGELRPYQQAGLGWLAFLAEFGLGGCLADDMGLGKTVQVLAWLATRRRDRQRPGEPRPSLVVAPKSVVFNWRGEAERFAPQLNVVDYTGVDRRARDEDLAAADLIVTSYGTLRNDVDRLKELRFDYAILDEAQAIKNPNSISAKSCRLLQADHRLALTGTPIENRLDDLWSIFEFLNPGMLGRSSALQSLARPQEGDEAASLEALRRGLAPFILRRTKQQVLKELPKKTEQTLHVELLPADRKRYDQLRDHYRASLLKRVADRGMNAARMHVLEALLRLRQAACHAGLIDAKLVDKPSGKVDALLEQVAEVAAEGHKALVFSQFTSLLAIVRRRLDAAGIAYEYLDGRTRNRQERVKRFQEDADCPLFLISLKAGGTGLNLTAADYVFLLDPWWNPAVEAQAIDRAHRIGQQRPVFAYRIVARDTVEEKILELQRRKRGLADAIVAADKGGMANLTAEDLRILLS